jgi:molybdate transport system permease protein
MSFDPLPLYQTIGIALCAMAVSVALGTPLAWVLARREFWAKHLVDALVMQPMVIPPTVLGYYLLVLLGRGSPLGGFLEDHLGMQLVFTWRGAVVAAAVAALPLYVKPARAAIEGVDRALEDAARLLGRGEWSVFRTITLPLAWRGLIAGAVMAFARAMGDFGTTLMVMGNMPGRLQTVSIAIYDSWQAGDLARANMLVGFVTAFSVAVLWGVSRWSGKL